MKTLIDLIKEKLNNTFHPDFLEIEDFSAQHQKHKEAIDFIKSRKISLSKEENKPSPPTHLKITIISSAFESLSRIERQKRVHDVLGKTILSHIHAVTLSLKTPNKN